jgi:hypothetical protein
VGLQFEGNIGGTKISPLAIMDGLPIVIPGPTAKDGNGNSIEQDPERVIVIFKHPFIGLTLSPSEVKETDANLVISAVATIAPRDSKETDAEVARRSALHDALTASAPSEACTTLAALKVVGGGITVTDLYKEEQFLLQNFKDQQAIAQEVWDSVKKLDPKTMPADLAKAVELSLQAGAEPIQHTLQNVLDTASTVKNVPAQIASKPSSVLTNPVTNPDPISRTVIQGIQNLFPSDARFKLDLVQVGMLANGVPLYRFRYRWSDHLYVGVLAQDVEKLLPTAVSKDSRGFLWVDYDQLGIKFLTWEDWSRSHPATEIPRTH